MSKKVVIVGGHGQVALRLARLLSNKQYAITSIIRTEDHIPDITAISSNVTPLVLSLEHSPISAFTEAIGGADIVVFSAGAGGKGDPDRTRIVDYEGAVKIYDAIEAVPGKRPHLLLVSAADVRDPDKIPPHYNNADRALSARARSSLSLGNYLHWKYQADKDLVSRTTFPWTILRPTGLTNGPGTGRADIGRTHITTMISLCYLRNSPSALTVEGGDIRIDDGLDKFIKKGETDWLD